MIGGPAQECFDEASGIYRYHDQALSSLTPPQVPALLTAGGGQGLDISACGVLSLHRCR